MRSKDPQLLEQALEELIRTIGKLSPEMLNAVPFEGSWSAGQVAVHVSKSLEGLPGLFSSGSVPTERDPHQFEAELKKIFLDFDSKMKSPESILPGNGPFEKQELLDRITSFGQAIDENNGGRSFPNLSSFFLPGCGYAHRI